MTMSDISRRITETLFGRATTGVCRGYRSRLKVLRLEDRTVPANFAWKGPEGGAWETPANWVVTMADADTGTLPGPKDDVALSNPAPAQGITITYNPAAAATVKSL